MPIPFTPGWVRNVKAEGKREQWADTVVPGLVLRVSPSGAKSYGILYRKGGEDHRLTLGKPSDDFTLAKAREMARAMLAKIRLGAHPVAEKRQAHAAPVLSVGDLVDRMLESVPLKPSTLKEWRRVAAVELPPIATRATGDLTRADIRLLLATIARRSVSTACHTFEVLRRAYSWGLDMELVPASPCAGLKHGYKRSQSDRVLSTPEVRALWQALELLGTWQRPDGVRLLLLTGTRKMMVLGSHEREFEGLDGPEAWRIFEGVTEAEPRWTIPAVVDRGNKAHRDHLVPLSPQALAIVRRRIEEGKDGYLFPTWYIRRKGRVPTPHVLSFPSKWILMLKVATRWALWRLQAADDEVGPRLAPMKRWKVHNLRHTMATHMREDLRIDRNVVALLLAHEQTGGGGATRIYDRAELLPERRAALIAWGAWLEAVAAGQPARVLPMPMKVRS
jgi:integrase